MDIYEIEHNNYYVNNYIDHTFLFCFVLFCLSRKNFPV